MVTGSLVGRIKTYLTKTRQDRWFAASVALGMAVFAAFVALVASTRDSPPGEVVRKMNQPTMLLGVTALALIVSGVALAANRRWGWVLLGLIFVASTGMWIWTKHYLIALLFLIGAVECRTQYRAVGPPSVMHVD